MSQVLGNVQVRAGLRRRPSTSAINPKPTSGKVAGIGTFVASGSLIWGADIAGQIG